MPCNAVATVRARLALDPRQADRTVVEMALQHYATRQGGRMSSWSQSLTLDLPDALVRIAYTTDGLEIASNGQAAEQRSAEVSSLVEGVALAAMGARIREVMSRVGSARLELVPVSQMETHVRVVVSIGEASILFHLAPGGVVQIMVNGSAAFAQAREMLTVVASIMVQEGIPLQSVGQVESHRHDPPPAVIHQGVHQ